MSSEIIAIQMLMYTGGASFSWDSASWIGSPENAKPLDVSCSLPDVTGPCLSCIWEAFHRLIRVGRDLVQPPFWNPILRILEPQRLGGAWPLWGLESHLGQFFTCTSPTCALPKIRTCTGSSGCLGLYPKCLSCVNCAMREGKPWEKNHPSLFSCCSSCENVVL